MISELLIYVALPIYIAFYIIKFIQDYRRGHSYVNGIPGPLHFGPIYNSPELFYNHHRIYDWAVETSRRFSHRIYSIRMPFGYHSCILSHPIHIEHALKTDFWCFEKGPIVRRNLYAFLGGGIFNSDGEQWQVQRKIASQIFHVRNFRDYFMRVFREECAIMTSIFRKHAQQGTVIDMYDLFHRFTMESFCRIGFGVRLDLLKKLLDGDETPVPFAVSFDRANCISEHRFTNPLWYITEHFDGTRKQLLADIETIDKFVFDIIRERREIMKQNVDESDVPDLLSRFMSVKADDSGRMFTDRELRDIIINLMLAGRDTTAQSLSWTFYEIFRNPGLNIAQQIRDEIRKEIPHFDPVDVADGDGGDAGIPTYEDILNLKYTKAVFQETLRLHPNVPLQPKVAVQDVTFPPIPMVNADSIDGKDQGEYVLKVPKGMHIVYSSYVLGRRPDIWGPDYLQFKPSRFLQEPSPAQNQFKFAVFNAGPRLCLGMNMAYLEAVCVLTFALGGFEFDPVTPIPLAASDFKEDVEEVSYKPGLTLGMKAGLKVRVRQTSDNALNQPQ